MPAIVDGVRSLSTGIERPRIPLKNWGDQHVYLSGPLEARTLLNRPTHLMQLVVRCYRTATRLAP